MKFLFYRLIYPNQYYSIVSLQKAEKMYREYEALAPENIPLPQGQIGTSFPAHNDTWARSPNKMDIAHLFLNENDPHENPTKMAVIHGWTHPDSHNEQNFVRRGIGYDPVRGRMIIRTSGIYKVYSHLVFKNGLSDKEMMFTQIIAREYGGAGVPHKDILLEDSEYHKCSSGQPQLPCCTSQLASQVHLRKGDELFVEVTNLHLLVANGRLSFFGLYKTSD